LADPAPLAPGRICNQAEDLMNSLVRTVKSTISMTLIMLILPAAIMAQAEPGTLSLELYLDMESVSSPRISPDGTQIVYTRSWVDKVNDRRSSDVWIMNADGSKNRFLVKGSSPTWSPDGARIAFLAQGEPRGSQIFVRWMDTEGATTQITHVEKSPGSLRWSPDGERIAFTMSVDDRSSWSVKLPPRPEGANWTDGPKIVDRLNYRRDRRGYIDTGYTHIFVVPADGGTPRQLTDGDWNHSGPEWTPDGQRILFSSLRVENADYQYRESEIYSVTVADGEIAQLTTRHGSDGGAVPSPDGELIAYAGIDFHQDTYRNRKIYIMEMDGSNPRCISEGWDRSPGSLTWAPDGSGVYFTVRSEGTSNLHFASVRGGVRKITEGNHMLSISTFDSRGTAVGTLGGHHEPGDIISLRLSRPDEIKRLTQVNEDVLGHLTLGDVEEVWYDSTDDLRIQGWIIKPPHFDPGQKYPLILAIHGGPHAMYSVSFNFAWQNHAANGYVVLYTNPRGSSGYGSAFGNAIKNAYPDKDFDDLMNGVDEVISRGYIDEDNLFVYGGSGGGVLTAWIVGHTDRFAAASSNYPVIDWLSFVGTTDGVSWYRNFSKFPWEDPSEHLRRSPLMYAGNVTTPTMLMTGEDDLRTPISQTEEFYQALKVQMVPTVMLRFRDEWHGTSSNPSNFMRSQLYLRSWFEKWKKP
jgi:dipeptidyl aminopeptidase/acylaminoacyl peptidase